MENSKISPIGKRAAPSYLLLYIGKSVNETDQQDAPQAEDGIDWAAVRRAYADPAIPLRETAARLGIPWQTLSARATREGWPKSLCKCCGRGLLIILRIVKLI